jgi:hypothetical protein
MRWTPAREFSMPPSDVGFIHVCDHSAEMTRSSVAARWADVGNLIVRDESELPWAMPQLLSVAAEWLLLGGVTRLVDYWAQDVDPPDYLYQLVQLGSPSWSSTSVASGAGPPSRQVKRPVEPVLSTRLQVVDKSVERDRQRRE